MKLAVGCLDFMFAPFPTWGLGSLLDLAQIVVTFTQQHYGVDSDSLQIISNKTFGKRIKHAACQSALRPGRLPKCKDHYAGRNPHRRQLKIVKTRKFQWSFLRHKRTKGMLKATKPL